MKTVISFDLPDERNELLLAQRGAEFFSAIIEIQNILRSIRKYDKPVEEAIKEIETIVYDCKTEDIE